MTYTQTEQIILEQVLEGNYSLSADVSYSITSLILTIPKSRNRMKIVVTFGHYFWDDKEDKYAPWHSEARKVRSVTVGNWWQWQEIKLHNEDLKQRLEDICVEYWSLKTVERHLDIAKEDAALAKKLRKVFEK